MTSDLLSFARRAVACPRWRWMPGMRASETRPGEEPFNVLVYNVSNFDQTDFRVIHWGGNTWKSHHAPDGTTWLPDLSDPATLGCLLALVREAYRVPCAVTLVQLGKTVAGYQFCYVRTGEDGWQYPSSVVPGREAVFAEYPTEAEALVAALEAAP